MESDTLRDQVKQAWDELQSQRLPLDEVVNVIVTEFPLNVRRDVIDILFTLVGSTNWQRASRGIPVISYSSTSPLYGCQTDEYGLVLDPITQGTISEDNLLTYTDDTGKKWCFDKYNLYRYWKLSGSEVPVNPFTKNPLPEYVVEELEKVSKPLVITVVDRSPVIVDSLVATPYDVIISVFSGNLLHDITLYDVASDGISLYDTTELPTTVSIEEFPSPEDRDRKLLGAYRYFKDHQDTSTTYMSLYKYIGVFLHLLPFFEGRNIPIAEDTTVIEALKLAWESVGGLDKWNAVDVVLDNGTPLYELELDESILSQAPGETIRIVHVPDNMEDSAFKHASLLIYARDNNDTDLLKLIDITPETVREALHLKLEDAIPRIKYITMVLGHSYVSVEEVAETLRPILYSGFLESITADAIFDAAIKALKSSGYNEGVSVREVVLKEYNYDDPTIDKSVYMWQCKANGSKDVARLDSVNLFVELLKTGTSVSELQNIVTNSILHHGWRILDFLIHTTNSPLSSYKLFEAVIKAHGVYSARLTEVVGQMRSLAEEMRVREIVSLVRTAFETAQRMDIMYGEDNVSTKAIVALIRSNEDAADTIGMMLLADLDTARTNPMSKMITHYASDIVQTRILREMVQSNNYVCSIARGIRWEAIRTVTNELLSISTEAVADFCINMYGCGAEQLFWGLYRSREGIENILGEYPCQEGSICEELRDEYSDFVTRRVEERERHYMNRQGTQ